MNKHSILLLFVPAMLAAQSLDPSVLLKALGTTGDWTSYSGDYSGRRYSALTQINQSTVKNLSLAWNTRLTAGTQGRTAGPNLIVAGAGNLEAAGAANIK